MSPTFNIYLVKPDPVLYLGRIIAVIEHADAGDLTTTYAYNAAGDLLTVQEVTLEDFCRALKAWVEAFK